LSTLSFHDRLRLDSRVALVTGGGAGIGRAISHGLASQGAQVAVLDIDLSAAEQTVKEITSLGAQATAWACNVIHAEEVSEVLATVIDYYKRLDIVVNSAGVISAPGMPFTNNSVGDWERVLSINLMGAVHICNGSYEALIKSDAARIINISSITGVISAAYMPPYSVSKAALISLSKVLARDLALHHITVNAVCPGFIWTPLWESLGKTMAQHSHGVQGQNAKEVFNSRVEQHVPMGRPQTLEDIADAVVFLSSSAASNITGQVLGVDGGVTI
jgi:NAD(P)-dependent dehydrogenase (short-subunit alcohol dehydrogenase family)